jgi:ribosomal-protein-alanine N-acetyltransferase
LVRRYLFDDQIADRETIETLVAKSCASFEKLGFGLWSVTGKNDGEFRGVCGFADSKGKADLLISIEPNYWGQGLATEAAQCVLRYGFESLRLSSVMATVDELNTVSIRLLEKLGMSLEEERLVKENSLSVYSMTIEDYQKQQARDDD